MEKLNKNGFHAYEDIQKLATALFGSSVRVEALVFGDHYVIKDADILVTEGTSNTVWTALQLMKNTKK